MTTTAVSHPDANWDFKILVPTNAVEIQVTVEAQFAPRGVVLMGSLVDRLGDRYRDPASPLGRIQGFLFEKMIWPRWQWKNVRSVKWIKHDGIWSPEKPEIR